MHKLEIGNMKGCCNVGGSHIIKVIITPGSRAIWSNILSSGSMICPCITVLVDSLLPWKYFIISVFPFVDPWPCDMKAILFHIFDYHLSNLVELFIYKQVLDNAYHHLSLLCLSLHCRKKYLQRNHHYLHFLNQKPCTTGICFANQHRHITCLTLLSV